MTREKKKPTDSSATLATASGLFGSTPGYVTDGHPFYVVGVGEGKGPHERRPVAYLAKPKFPPFYTLNEVIEVSQDVPPSLVTCNGRGLFSTGS